MDIYNRKYKTENNDFEKLYSFIVDDAKYRKNNFVWHIARLVDWKYNLLNFRKMIPSNLEDYTHLWFNSDNELVGFVLSEDINNYFQVFSKKGYEYLYKEMVNWFVNEFSSQYNDFEIVINEGQTYEKEILESIGFKITENREVTFAIDTNKYTNYGGDLKGCSFVSMEEKQDHASLMELRDNIWPTKMDKEQELAIREYTRKSPIYRDDFNFVLVNETGQFVAGCEAFIDVENKTSEIERICTHSDFWNNGYAKIILRSAMKKLNGEGIQTAYITGWDDKTIHLYGSLGHDEEINRFCYKFSKNINNY